MLSGHQPPPELHATLGSSYKLAEPGLHTLLEGQKDGGQPHLIGWGQQKKSLSSWTLLVKVPLCTGFLSICLTRWDRSIQLGQDGSSGNLVSWHEGFKKVITNTFSWTWKQTGTQGSLHSRSVRCTVLAEQKTDLPKPHSAPAAASRYLQGKPYAECIAVVDSEDD